MRVDVYVRGVPQAVGLIDRLSRRLTDGTPQLLGLVDLLTESQSERFAGRGTRWRKPAPSTVLKDAQQNRDPRILVLTGALMRSLTVRGDPQQRVEVHPGRLRFGTRLYYAAFHKRGDGVPRRNPVGLTRVQRSNVVTELRDLLTEGL